MVNVMTTKLKSFQTDLKNGMSIHDALIKHNLTFKQAVETIYKPHKPHKTSHPTNEKYILHRDGHYYLRKHTREKLRLFGTYHTLEDAMKVRDYCIKYGWKQHSIDKYCEELGVKRCIHPKKGKNRRYH